MRRRLEAFKVVQREGWLPRPESGLEGEGAGNRLNRRLSVPLVSRLRRSRSPSGPGATSTSSWTAANSGDGITKTRRDHRRSRAPSPTITRAQYGRALKLVTPPPPWATREVASHALRLRAGNKEDDDDDEQEHEDKPLTFSDVVRASDRDSTAPPTWNTPAAPVPQHPSTTASSIVQRLFASKPQLPAAAPQPKEPNGGRRRSRSPLSRRATCA